MVKQCKWEIFFLIIYLVVLDHGEFAVYYSTLVFPKKNGLEFLLPLGYHGIEM